MKKWKIGDVAVSMIECPKSLKVLAIPAAGPISQAMMMTWKARRDQQTKM